MECQANDIRFFLLGRLRKKRRFKSRRSLIQETFWPQSAAIFGYS